MREFAQQNSKVKVETSAVVRHADQIAVVSKVTMTTGEKVEHSIYTETIYRGRFVRNKMAVLLKEMKVGMVWQSGGRTFKVVALDRKVKTPAGEFQCLIIRDVGNKVDLYWAKGLGMILAASQDGKHVYVQLTSVKKP